MTAEAAQNDSLCFATVAASLETREAGNQAKIIRNRMRELHLKPTELRLRLTALGYHPSTLDPFLDVACFVYPWSDSVGLALQALGLMDAHWIRESAFVQLASNVTIAGEVQQPGDVVFREGMTLGDLIRDAGSLMPTADLTLEVYRVMRRASRERLVVPEIHSIRVDSAYLVDHDANRIYAKHIAGFTYLIDRAAAFKLKPYDRVVVKALRRARLYPTLPPTPGRSLGGRREEATPPPPHRRW